MWDDQIDHVARKLTDAPAPAGFRSRVLARLEARSDPRWRRMPLAVWSAVAVAALVLIVALVVGRHDRIGRETTARVSAPPSEPSRPSRPAAANGPSPATAQPSSEPPDGTATRVAAVVRSRGTAQPSADLVFAVVDPEAIESLVLPVLMAEAPVTTDPLSTEPIVIEVLQISPLDDQALDQ